MPVTGEGRGAVLFLVGVGGELLCAFPSGVCSLRAVIEDNENAGHILLYRF